jgi:hypothetical protein
VENRLRTSEKYFQASGICAIDSPHRKKLKILFSLQYTDPESGAGKHFQASGMCAIDSPHRITPNKVIFRKIIFGSKIHEKKGKVAFLRHPVSKKQKKNKFENFK